MGRLTMTREEQVLDGGFWVFDGMGEMTDIAMGWCRGTEVADAKAYLHRDLDFQPIEIRSNEL